MQKITKIIGAFMLSSLVLISCGRTEDSKTVKQDDKLNIIEKDVVFLKDCVCEVMEIMARDTIDSDSIAINKEYVNVDEKCKKRSQEIHEKYKDIESVEGKSFLKLMETRMVEPCK
jgi:uncharacterized lipoprotein YehR (DUF1307 family)